MFKFLKDKITKAVDSFSKKVDEEGEEVKEDVSVQVEEALEKPEETKKTEPKQEGSQAKKHEEEHEEEPEEELAREPIKGPVEEEIEKEPIKSSAESKESTRPEEKKEESPEVQNEPPEEEKPESSEKKPEEDEPKPKEKDGFFAKLKKRFAHREEAEPGEEYESVPVIENPQKEVEVKEPEEEKESEQKEEIRKEIKEIKEDITEKKAEEKKIMAAEPEEKASPEKIESSDSKEPKDSTLPPEKKEGFLKKIRESVTKKKISRDKFEDLFWELEMVLLENNVAMEVIEKIKDDLAEDLVDKPLLRNKINDAIEESLRISIKSLFEAGKIDLMSFAKKKRPFVICFIGVNGSGKTTTIAKVAYIFKNMGRSVVLAASDTFRAAAIDQLSHHADKLGVKIIKHDYGSDAAAVAFDAVKHAKSKDKDIVLIDTAGRLHSNKNLMDELRKLIRVANPDLKIFVGESITGNDCIEQAKQFNDAVGIDGIILTKADIDEKGGASISISYVTKRPVLYLGTGQEYPDLVKFDKEKIIESLGL